MFQRRYLDIVALDDSNLAIHDHKLGMKCSEHRTMKVLDFYIDIRNFRIGRESNAGGSPFRFGHIKVIIEHLVVVSSAMRIETADFIPASHYLDRI